MLTAIVQFVLPESMTANDASAFFANISQMFYDIPGLVRKYFLVDPASNTAGAVYLWESREAANSYFTENFKLMIQERFGAVPSITYFDCPVVVESQAGETILSKTMRHR